MTEVVPEAAPPPGEPEPRTGTTSAEHRTAPIAAEEDPSDEGSRRGQGEMSLPEHLSELRGRLIKSALAIVLATVLAWYFYPEIFAFISRPINQVIAEAQAQGRTVQVVVLGVAEPFVLQMKVSAICGVILAAPVWIYQLWRFVTPGLHRNERRIALTFAAVATPLFLAGAALAYVVLPKGLSILFGFTPENVGNYVEVSKYLSFLIRMVLVFGIGFLAPVFIVALNFAGVLSGERLRRAWRFIIFGVFLFAAVATPTGDPINLLILAVPILLLVGASIGICVINDRRRAKASPEPDYSSLSDDEASPL